jgi:hypothetical protein
MPGFTIAADSPAEVVCVEAYGRDPLSLPRAFTLSR